MTPNNTCGECYRPIQGQATTPHTLIECTQNLRNDVAKLRGVVRLWDRIYRKGQVVGTDNGSDAADAHQLSATAILETNGLPEDDEPIPFHAAGDALQTHTIHTRTEPIYMQH